MSRLAFDLPWRIRLPVVSGVIVAGGAGVAIAASLFSCIYLSKVPALARRFRIHDDFMEHLLPFCNYEAAKGFIKLFVQSSLLSVVPLLMSEIHCESDEDGAYVLVANPDIVCFVRAHLLRGTVSAVILTLFVLP